MPALYRKLGFNFRRLSILVLYASLSLLLCGLNSGAAFAQTPVSSGGNLDVTFGGTGKVAPAPAGTQETINAVAVQPDGKIVVAGLATITGGTGFIVSRFNTDGSPDTAFGGGGSFRTTFGSNNGAAAYAVMIQPDGKIVIAGSGTDANNLKVFAVARFTSAGLLDTTFGTNGKATATFFVPSNFGFAAALQPDGKIVLAGYTGETNTPSDMAIVRFTSTGALDSNFGTNGKARFDFNNTSIDVAYALALQADGKIVIAGYSETAGNDVFALIRVTSTGLLDTTFGNGGKVSTDFAAGTSDIARGLTIGTDGRIIAVGATSINEQFDFAIAQYNSNGSPDTTFGTNGTVITDFPDGPTPRSNSALAVVIQPDNKFIVAGVAQVPPTQDFAIARYNTSGALDTSFGNGGRVTTDFGNTSTNFTNDTARALALQPDGRIIAGGVTVKTDNTTGYALARYIGMPTTTTANAGDIIITEFRFNGANSNATDEFVELYNAGATDIIVADTAGGAGWLLARSNGASGSNYLVPNGTFLPSHRHLLIANTGFSLQNSGGTNRAIPDLVSTFDLPANGGIALFASSLSTGTRLDAVAFSNVTNNLYYEGTPLTPISTTTGTLDQYSFVRKLNAGAPQDTGDNAADFVLISPTGVVGSTVAALGAAGPENLFAPIVKTPAQIVGQYLDPTTSGTVAPNRILENNTLKIRRTYTNNTGADIRRLRFRIIDLTTLNNRDAATEADLRVVSSTDETLSTAMGNKTALGLTREEPPDQTSTMLDGGLHTTLNASTITLTNPLRTGQSINVNFWLRRVAGGRFRFYVNIEALL
jgi:uncharacterized delta-60 repeat protein